MTGGYVYRGAAIPALRGYYLFADYGSGTGVGDERPGGRAGRVRRASTAACRHISSFGQDARGELYIVSLRRRRVQASSPALGRPRQRSRASRRALVAASDQEPAPVTMHDAVRRCARS